METGLAPLVVKVEAAKHTHPPGTHRRPGRRYVARTCAKAIVLVILHLAAAEGQVRLNSHSRTRAPLYLVAVQHGMATLLLAGLRLCMPQNRTSSPTLAPQLAPSWRRAVKAWAPVSICSSLQVLLGYWVLRSRSISVPTLIGLRTLMLPGVAGLEGWLQHKRTSLAHRFGIPDAFCWAALAGLSLMCGGTLIYAFRRAAVITPLGLLLSSGILIVSVAPIFFIKWQYHCCSNTASAGAVPTSHHQDHIGSLLTMTSVHSGLVTVMLLGLGALFQGQPSLVLPLPTWNTVQGLFLSGLCIVAINGSLFALLRLFQYRPTSGVVLLLSAKVFTVLMTSVSRYGLPWWSMEDTVALLLALLGALGYGVAGVAHRQPRSTRAPADLALSQPSSVSSPPGPGTSLRANSPGSALITPTHWKVVLGWSGAMLCVYTLLVAVSLR